MPVQLMHHQASSNMVLGCFIGVMILLAIMIILIAVSDNRVNKMLTNQTTQMSQIRQIGEALGIKNIAGKAKNYKSGFLTGTNGTQTNQISPAQYPNTALARTNSQLSSSISSGGSINYNPILDGCGSGNCSSGNSGMGLYSVNSAASGTDAPSASSEAQAELNFFSTIIPDFAAAASSGTSSSMSSTQSRPAPPIRPTR